MAAITYPISVRSLADMFPDLRQIPTLASHRINEGKAAGDAFDTNAACDAEKTVRELEPLRRKLHSCMLFLCVTNICWINSGIIPELSHAHIEGAKNRAHVLRSIRE